MNTQQRGVEDVAQPCLECGRLCCNRRSLGNHLARSHKNIGGQRGYVLKHFMSDVIPLCACGCQKPVEWHALLYKFNTYITGHNDAGFRVCQPVFTPAQIQNRNASITATYDDETNNLKGKGGKVSVAVVTAYQDPVTQDNHAKGVERRWADPEQHVAASTSQVLAWSGEAGELRRAKVFTPEFNAKRTLARIENGTWPTHTSEGERIFVAQLGSMLGTETQTGRFFTYIDGEERKIWNPDTYMPEHNAFVEFDGAYWHGLDRNEQFTVAQLEHIANDLWKNRLAIEHKLTLLRVKEKTDITDVKTFDDLKNVAYHVVVDGVVEVDGTMKLADDQVLISREQLIKMDKEYVENEVLPALIAVFKRHVQLHGWFYPVEQGTLERSLHDLHTGLGWIEGQHSNLWLKSLVKSYWDVDGGPMKAFNNDATLKRVLKYRLGLNNSKPYQYKLSDGSTVTTNETFNITLREVRRGFVVQHNTVSWFKPAHAAHVYRTFLTGIEKPVVWDPSIGFSARLLGFAGFTVSGTYIGTDPAQAMIFDAERLKTELTALRQGIEIQLHKQGSETFLPAPCSLDLVFTSPPYIDRERYFDEPGQCWKDHPSLDAWAKRFLAPTLANALVGLKPGRHLVLNVEPDLVDVVVALADSVGFERRPDMDAIIKLRADHFARKNGRANAKSEPFLVFRKPGGATS